MCRLLTCSDESAAQSSDAQAGASIAHGRQQLFRFLLQRLALETQTLGQARCGRGRGLGTATPMQKYHAQHAVQHSQTQVCIVCGEMKEEEDKLKGPQTSLNYLMKRTKVQTYWWSSQKLCISTLACRNVWQIRGRGCQRSWCSAVGVRSHVGASSAKAQCSYRLRAHGPHTYNRTQSQTRLGVNPTQQLINCRLHQVKRNIPGSMKLKLRRQHLRHYVDYHKI